MNNNIELVDNSNTPLFILSHIQYIRAIVTTFVLNLDNTILSTLEFVSLENRTSWDGNVL